MEKKSYSKPKEAPEATRETPIPAGYKMGRLDVRHSAAYIDGQRIPLNRFKRQEVFILVPEVT